MAAIETYEEESLPESLLSQVLYAPEDEDLEEEQDPVVPQNVSNPAEIPPPSPDVNDNANQAPPEMESNDPQINDPQEEPEREANANQVESETEANTRQAQPGGDQRVPSPPPSPGKFHSSNMPRIPKSMLHL